MKILEMLKIQKYDVFGFDKKGIHKDTEDRVDKHGFDKKGIHQDTGRRVDKHGFNRRGIHEDTGNILDTHGFNIDGEYQGMKNVMHDPHGFDIDGIHKITKKIYDPRGFDIDGIHCNGTKYDSDGYDRDYRREETRDDGLGREKSNVEKIYEGFKEEWKKFIMNKEIEVKNANGEIIKPTEEDVDRCIKYLEDRNTDVSLKAIEETVREYLKGNITIAEAELGVEQQETQETELESLELEQQQLREILIESEQLESQVDTAIQQNNGQEQQKDNKNAPDVPENI